MSERLPANIKSHEEEDVERHQLEKELGELVGKKLSSFRLLDAFSGIQLRFEDGTIVNVDTWDYGNDQAGFKGVVDKSERK